MFKKNEVLSSNKHQNLRFVQANTFEFANSVLNDNKTLVSAEDGFNALKIASIINEKLKLTSDFEIRN